MSRLKVRGAVAVVVAFALGVGVALASHRFDSGYEAGGIERVKVLQGDDATDHVVDMATTAWQTLDNGQVPMTADDGDLILARFSARSSCVAENPVTDRCFVRILIGSTVALPGGKPAQFDGYDPNPDGVYESHSIDAALGVAPGSHNVRVQWRAAGAAIFTIDTWSLTVERATAP